MKPLEELIDTELPSGDYVESNFNKHVLSFLQLTKKWLEQPTTKANYLTAEELEMSREDVNLQIVLGLQTCKTKHDVCQLLDDVRRHERLQIIKRLKK